MYTREIKLQNMNLLTIAPRTYSRRALRKVVGASSSCGTRFYSGDRSQVDHFVSGWNTEDIEKFKDTDKYCTQTFNNISEIGLSVFAKDLYDVVANDSAGGRPAHALMLRSHKLKEEEVLPSVRAIAR